MQFWSPLRPPRPGKTWNLVVCFMQALSQTFFATLKGLSVCRHSKSTNDIDTTHSAINGPGQRSGYRHCRWAETRRARWWLSQLTTFSAEPGPSARRNTSPQKMRRSVPSLAGYRHTTVENPTVIGQFRRSCGRKLGPRLEFLYQPACSVVWRDEAGRGPRRAARDRLGGSSESHFQGSFLGTKPPSRLQVPSTLVL